MGIFFRAYSSSYCCLCGSTEDLTGEHKIKASAIRSTFGADKMVIGRFDGTGEKPRSVQGPKSKELHFESRVCRKCNSERTQNADREFDRLNQKCREYFGAGKDPKEVFVLPEYAKDSASYFNVFRYFAKLLCCHIAEVQGPRPVHLSKFAVSDFELNFVWLDIGPDPIYAAFSKELGEHQYAAHGGLAILRDRKSSRATGFQSTLTIGPIKYTFFDLPPGSSLAVM